MTSPLLSLVVPCYRVARYLPAFLASVDAQTLDSSRFEIIFVIDGSPDESEAIVREWQGRSGVQTQIFVTPNRGVSAARNTGIEAATGEWITFPDPDDRLGDGYLASIAASLEADGDPALIATRLTMFSEADGRLEAHQLDYRYSAGSREVDLASEPDFLQLAVHTAVFRRSVIEAHGIRFDPRVRVFEDGKFVADYLLACGHQRIAVDTGAVYLYTKRADDSSALALANRDPVARYRDTIRFAHLELLASAGVAPPRWLENYVLYDLYWLFEPFLEPRHAVHGAAPEELAEVAELATEVLRRISPQTIMEFAVVDVRPEVRGAWLIGSTGVIPERWVCTVRHDAHQRLREYRTLCSSTEFDPQAAIGGETVVPRYAKWREVPLLGRVWLVERVVWIDDRPGIRFTPGEAAIAAGEGIGGDGSPRTLAEHSERLGWIPKPPPAPENGPGARTGFKTLLWHGIAKIWGLLPAWRRTWVFIDRDTQASDNAEAMFRETRRLRPHANACFVIDKCSPDYGRLKREGLRVLPHGSLRHFIAMRSARFLISSQADHYIMFPFEHMRLWKRWDFVFLQHGVTQNSLYRWLNSMDIQLLVTATPDEYAAFVSDPGPYNFSDHETALTGFPRHDPLYRKLVATGQKSLFLIMPTWRQYLTANPDATESNERELVDDFDSSDYVREWSSFLGDPRLLQICEAAGLAPAILLHPNFEQHLGRFRLPQAIRRLSYSRDDVQAALAASAITMTDYSSQAFEGAFCGAPAIYFQFDRDTFFSGGHIASPGYFDVERDGFGPVVLTAGDALAALQQLADGTHPELQEYRARIEALYAYHDDGATRRIIEAMTDRFGA